MAMVINSNIMSLNAQRNLTASQNDLNTSMERLSSGKRINSAADDAAGLAISSRLTSEVRGLNQAVRNANDGISLIQTAEGALDESTNILQRMRELSIQSSSGTYSEGNRATLNAEVQQLVQELDRIASTTSFNGQNILDGSLGSVKLQVGAQANQTIEMSIQAMDSSTLGLGSQSADLSGAVMTAIDIQDGDVLINGSALDAHDSTTKNIDDLLSNINSNVEGVTATAFNVMEAGANATGVLTAGDSFTITVGSTNGSDAVVYQVGSGTAADGITSSNLDEMVDLINSTTGGAVTASINADNGRLVLSNTTGGTITIDDVDNTPVGNATGFTDTDSQLGSIAMSSDDGSAITVTTGANGTDADLESLGFRRVEGQGVVIGEELSPSGEQDTVLAVNDLKINGVSISAVAADGGTVNTLAEKVANINAVSDDTGVTAATVAQSSFAVNLAKVQHTVTATAAPDMTAIASIAADADLKLNGVELTGIAALTASSTVEALAAVINGETANTGVTASVDNSGYLTLSSDTAFTFTGANNGDSGDLGTGMPALDATTGATTLGADDGSIKINGYEVANIDLDDIDAAIADINGASGNTGVTASIDDNGQLQLSGNSAITIEMGQENGAATAARLGITFASDSNSDGANDSVTLNARIKLDSANDKPISIDVTANGATATGLSDMNTDLSGTVNGTALSSIDISTVAGAQKAIGAIDNALDTINSSRGDLGAISNRLDFTINNLSNISENASAARSRIEDADFAAESAALSRAQVLQQAGTAMLAQANAAPQQVLSLLQ
ncbi:flagellin N-terminal helical domain-containing protein [Marinobacterium rhizophilum]|uniref:Flagellin n=1 Tax=Marinobacterium rhizophilum TaxID=420402 RepID=A0ABY5HDJ5_9GAMM|nr:flagellin [Marinobacterium rhizophilum]UTW10049.1 flagellin [Marinobacterium rhizophilum]